MKILCVCDQGNNRSVHLAHLLKYWDHDTIPVGLATTSIETLEMLYNWADRILTTSFDQKVPGEFADKVKLIDIGPDIYPRPFNPELHAKVKQLLELNKDWLKV